MANIAYIRVSTIEQKEDRQFKALEKYNIDRFFHEKVSGKNRDRVELNKMIEYVRDGDIVYIESLSRLGRSTKDLIMIVEELNNKNVQLISLKENIDTTTPTGKLTFNIFASLAEFERATIKERQKEGIAVAKLKGRHLGRPKLIYPDIFNEVYTQWKNKDITAVKAYTILNLKKTSFYKLVKQYELL